MIFCLCPSFCTPPFSSINLLLLSQLIWRNINRQTHVISMHKANFSVYLCMYLKFINFGADSNLRYGAQRCFDPAIVKGLIPFSTLQKCTNSVYTSLGWERMNFVSCGPHTKMMVPAVWVAWPKESEPTLSVPHDGSGPLPACHCRGWSLCHGGSLCWQLSGWSQAPRPWLRGERWRCLLLLWTGRWVPVCWERLFCFVRQYK